jgi:hypothetical protein
MGGGIILPMEPQEGPQVQPAIPAELRQWHTPTQVQLGPQVQ